MTKRLPALPPSNNDNHHAERLNYKTFSHHIQEQYTDNCILTESISFLTFHRSNPVQTTAQTLPSAAILRVWQSLAIIGQWLTIEHFTQSRT